MNTHSLNLVSSSSQAVSIADHADLKPTGNFTVEGWIKTTHTSDQIIFQSYSQNSNVAGIRLGLADSGSHVQLISGRNNGTTLGTHWQVVTGSIAVNTGNWTHVCAVYNGSTISVYVNGVLDAQTSWSNNAGYAGTNYVRVGALNTSGSNSSYFNGRIDELRLWSDARTASEIQDNMFQELTPGTDNLVEVWHWNNSLDSATGNHNGTGVNSPTFSTDVPNWRSNHFSIDFESSSSQYATTPDANDLSIVTTGQITFEAWVKVESLSNNNWLFFKGGNTNQYEYGCIVGNANGQIDFTAWNLVGSNRYQVVSPTGTLVAGQWYHIAITVDDTIAWNSGNAKIYVNGFLLTSGTGGGSGQILGNGTEVLNIGRRSDSGLYFDGMVNLFRVWSDLRTPSEQKAYMFQSAVGQSGLVAEWLFDNVYTDSSGNGHTLTPQNSPVFQTDVPFPEYTEVNPLPLADTTLFADANLQFYSNLDANFNDLSPNGYTLTPGNSPTDVAGKFSGAKKFVASSSQYAVTSGATNLRITGSQTMMGWVKPDSTAANRSFFAISNSSNANFVRIRQVSTDGLLWGEIDGLTYTGGAKLTFPAKIPNGEWVHTALVYDASNNKIYAYINGIRSETNVISGSHSATDAEFAVGRQGAFNSQFADGAVDDVAVFNRALTPTEIFELYTGLNLASSITKVSGVSRSSIKKVSSIALASVGRISGVQ